MSTATWKTTLTLDGRRSSESLSVTYDNIKGYKDKSLSAALAGTLSTRTDNDTGVVTLASGHGITTDDYLCVAWLVNGVWTYRYNVDVTASASTTVSIDLGSGTNLPIATTVVYVSIRQREECLITGVASVMRVVNLLGSKDCLFVMGSNVTAMDTPTYDPLVVTPTSPYQQAFAMLRGVDLNTIVGVSGYLPNWEGANVLQYIDVYNLDTEANVVSALIGHN